MSLDMRSSEISQVQARPSLSLPVDKDVKVSDTALTPVGTPPRSLP